MSKSDVIYFVNDGVFDVRAMLTFGVSAKSSASAIGYFGTGFKYAIAIVLRNGGKVTVKSGEEEFVFTAKTEIIREQEFELVYCNGVSAGFTTRLGLNWLPWMAYRELRCNAEDEGGGVATSETLEGEWTTVIEVDCPQIVAAHAAQAEYFLQAENPAFKTDECEIYAEPSRTIYYKGVAIVHTEEAGLFTYNIISRIELTEDRTPAWSYQYKDPIARALQLLDDERLVNQVLSSEKGIEADSDWHAHRPSSETFIEAARTRSARGDKVPNGIRNMLRVLRDQAGDWPEIELTALRQGTLKRSLDFLDAIAIPARSMEIKVVQGLGSGVMGRAHDGKIYLSEIPFNLGTKQVASTLMEEWLHNSTGCSDFDREMQNWLFDKILSMAEEFRGEPL